VGPKHAQVLIFCERAAIETTVLEKGHVEDRSELRGEKWFALKPSMDAPTIAWSHESHSPRSYRETKSAFTRQKSGRAFLDRGLVTTDEHMREGA
jgi:hypothetical protein